MYLIYSEPFKVMKMNKIEVFNEATILLSAYHMMLFTDFLPDIEKQYMAGYSMIAVTLMNVAVNTLIMGIETFYRVKNGSHSFKNKVVKLWNVVRVKVFKLEPIPIREVRAVNQDSSTSVLKIEMV